MRYLEILSEQGRMLATVVLHQHWVGVELISFEHQFRFTSNVSFLFSFWLNEATINYSCCPKQTKLNVPPRNENNWYCLLVTYLSYEWGVCVCVCLFRGTSGDGVRHFAVSLGTHSLSTGHTAQTECNRKVDPGPMQPPFTQLAI